MERIVNNPKLRVLLSIRNFSKALEKHYDQMKQIEESLESINKNASATIEAHSSKEGLEKWNYSLKEVNESVYSIDGAIHAMQEMVEERVESKDSERLWQQFNLYEITLMEAVKDSEKLGFEILPESEHKHWQKDICNFEDTIVSLIISHIEACKAELMIIEKYFPEKISKVTQVIADHIPENFTFEEAAKYEKDYLRAFENFKKEFSPEKNLWDKFLDILAGGTHQPPSERVMLQRWINGDKQDL